MSGPTDIGLLRFLHARVDETAVLNDDAGPTDPRPDLAAALLPAARALVAGGGTVAYAALAGSEPLRRYRALTGALATFDPATLAGDAARTAFWLNVYNALVIDGVISYGVRGSIRETPGFFRRAAYRVGGRRYSLDDIEHGVLRGNRPPYPRTPPPFAAGDPRAHVGPGSVDPRIHFALNCGTRSCPPVAFYDPATLDAQLHAAAATFVNDAGVRLCEDAVVLSPIFDRYAADFGGPGGGVRDWLLRYLDAGPARTRLLEGASPRVAAYDWSLNDAGRGDGRDG
jgi:hypothetical protein